MFLSRVAEPHDSQGILKASPLEASTSSTLVAEPHDSQGILKALMSETWSMPPSAVVAEPHDSQGILKEWGGL